MYEGKIPKEYINIAAQFLAFVEAVGKIEQPVYRCFPIEGHPNLKRDPNDPVEGLRNVLEIGNSIRGQPYMYAST
ncbi:MAG: hypothetical protein QXZ43_04565 [Candidatus Aenigmatarchaeota archaeon]